MAICRTSRHAELLNIVYSAAAAVGWTAIAAGATAAAADLVSGIACSSAALNSSNAAIIRDCRIFATSALLRPAISERMFEFA
jgi:hypothetical protein